MTATDIDHFNTTLATRPAHQTSRMSWPVDEDTTRRLRRVIALTEGDAGLWWWRRVFRRFWHQSPST
jgi:hypothetical protein